MDDVRDTGHSGPPLRVVTEGLSVASAWLLFAGSLGVQDLALAAGLGLVAAVGGAALRRRVGHRPAGSRTWAPLLAASLVGMLRDSWIVTASLARRPLGHRPAHEIREVPFDVGGADAGSATRRAVATFLTTLQPNSVLLGFDRERGVALVHVLERQDRPIVARRLRGGP